MVNLELIIARVRTNFTDLECHTFYEGIRPHQQNCNLQGQPNIRTLYLIRKTIARILAEETLSQHEASQERADHRPIKKLYRTIFLGNVVLYLYGRRGT